MATAAMRAAGAVVPSTRPRSMQPPQAAAAPPPHPQLHQCSRSHSHCALSVASPTGRAAACVPAPVPATRSHDLGRRSVVLLRPQRSLIAGAQGSSGEGGGGDSAASRDADASVAKRLALLELLSSGSEDEGDERVVTFTTVGSSSSSTTTTTATTTTTTSSNVDEFTRGDGRQQYGESGEEEGSGWPGAAGRRAGAPLTVREKMMQDYGVLVRGVVVIPLGRRAGFVLKDAAPQTRSQLRNQRRGEYLAKIGQRNDSPFFATVAGLVLVPPFAILAFALASGYLEFLQ